MAEDERTPQGTPGVGLGMKVAIIAALVVAIAGAVYLKQHVPGATGASTPLGQAAQGSAAEAAAAKPLPRLVDLGAHKCIPCKMMAPILDELRKDYAGCMEVEFIDVWENPTEKERYRIRGIPTQIFYDTSGRELFRHEGFFSKQDILAKWDELGVVIRRGEDSGP